LHDRGKVLVHSALMLAGGGESCADIEHLRAQTDLFGHVASDSTVYRTFHEIAPETRAAIARGFAEVRWKVWRRTAATKGCGPIFLDIDASLIEVHSENKELTGPNYKGGFGFHPVLRRLHRRGTLGSAPPGQRRVQHRERPRVGPR
jgi:hypothetical protein